MKKIAVALLLFFLAPLPVFSEGPKFECSYENLVYSTKVPAGEIELTMSTTGFQLATFTTMDWWDNQLKKWGHMNTIDERKAIIENQIKPISDSFDLDIHMPTINCFALDPKWGGYIWIRTKLPLTVPETSLSELDYSIIRNGVQIEKRTDFVRPGDTIQFRGKAADEPTLPNHGYDWITAGSNIDTPPVHIVDKTEFKRLYDGLSELFNARYPCNFSVNSYYSGWPFNDLEHYFTNYGYCKEPIPVFKVEKTSFDDKANHYPGPMGYEAYVIPIINGAKIGMQVFCAIKTTGTAMEETQGEAGRIQTPSGCETKENVMECPVRINEGWLSIQANANLECILFIDKYIKHGEAIQADWFSEYYSLPVQNATASKHLYFQVIPKGKEPPVADFSCKMIEEGQYGKRGKFLECNGSSSHGSNGKIELFEWDNIISPNWTQQYNKPIYRKAICEKGQGMVTLKVTDSEGYTGETTKTIRFDDSGNAVQDTFTLTVGYKEEMAWITAECEGIVTLDIEEATERKTEIEKVEIPCGETTPIGPFTVKGAYNVIATNNGTKAEAIFTVD